MTAAHPSDGAGGAPFGPAFFLGQLRAFARDRCPDPGEGMPAVQIHLVTGDALDLCHVIGLGPAFAALAVLEGEGEPRRMRTELVPYQLISRVIIRPPGSRGHVGFDVDHAPRAREARALFTTEAALGRAVDGSSEGLGPGPSGTDPP